MSDVATVTRYGLAIGVGGGGGVRRVMTHNQCGGIVPGVNVPGAVSPGLMAVQPVVALYFLSKKTTSRYLDDRYSSTLTFAKIPCMSIWCTCTLIPEPL